MISPYNDTSRLQAEVENKSQQMKLHKMEMEHYQKELQHFQMKARFYKEV